MKYIVLLTLSLLVASCANLTPKTYVFEKTSVVALTEDVVLRRVTAWMAENEFTIQNSSNGVIFAESDLTKIQGTYMNGMRTMAARRCADCGENVGGFLISRHAKLNVIVSKVDDSHCKVTVNFTPDATQTLNALQCTSNGQVESDIFALLKN